MLQVPFIRENRDQVIQGLAKRNKDFTTQIDAIIALDETRRKTQNDLDNLLAEVNKLSKEIGEMMKSGRKDDAEKIKTLALKALRGGDFDFALQAVQRGEANIPDMVEDLKIYQAELEVQNEELRDAQQHAETAMRRFNVLFATLPLPTLEIDELGVVSECNDKAEDFFDIQGSQLRRHFFQRLLARHEQLRLREAIA